MKKYLFVLATLLLTLTVGHGQTNKYFLFPDSNTTWFSWKSWLSPPPSSVGIQLEIWDWLTGDTLIGSYTYKKIQEYTYCQNNGSTTFGYAGAIRQDTSQKKVFYRLPSTTKDTLLYDFNLSVGDTIPQNSYINGGSNIISSIDSILVGTTYRKRFNITMSFSTESLIEGIGSTMGLLLPLSEGVEHSSFLYCFTQNGQNLFINPNGFCSSNPLNVSEQDKKFLLTVSPNPFCEQTTLQTDNLFKNATLTVYNSFGQEVKEIKNISGQAITLFRDDLPSGLYCIRLTEGNKIFATDKLVVTDN